MPQNLMGGLFISRADVAQLMPRVLEQGETIKQATEIATEGRPTMTTKATAASHDISVAGNLAPGAGKKDKIIYWTTTGIVAAVMLWSAYNFSFNAEMKGAFAHLGLPGWFRVELTVAKILGAVALLVPSVPARIKEFAYFGFAITLVSASIAHLSSGDSALFEIGHLAFFASLTISYLYFHKAINVAK